MGAQKFTISVHRSTGSVSLQKFKIKCYKLSLSLGTDVAAWIFLVWLMAVL